MDAERTTQTGIPIRHCDTCGTEHPITRTHCIMCGRASLFVHPTDGRCFRCHKCTLKVA